MNLLELAKKYNLSILNNRLVVPAGISDEEIRELLDAGYLLTFEL